MKRYCILDGKSSLEDDEKYFDINFKRIIEAIISQGEEHKPTNQEFINKYNGVLGKYSFYSEIENWNNMDQLIEENFELVNILTKDIPLSFEFTLDVIDEILLDIMYEEKENLFIDHADDLNKHMKDTISNIKKEHVNCTFLFGRENVQSTSKKTQISVFGSGLIRLWLSSSKFRKIFVENTTRFEKYKADEIYEMLDKGEQDGIKYEIGDKIILEKLLGISTGKVFGDFIINCLEDPDSCQWKDLLNILLEFGGERSRVAIIQAIGLDLYNWRNGARKNEDKRIIVYIKILEKLLKEYNQIYHKAVVEIRELSKKAYRLSEIKFLLLEKRAEIQRVGYPVFLNEPMGSFKLYEREIEEFLKILDTKEKKVEKIKFIKEQIYIRKRILPFYLESDEGVRKIYYKAPVFNENTRIMNQVRRIAIEKNKLKYGI